MFRIGDLEDFIAIGFVLTEPFNQWPQLRKNRDGKSGRSLVPKRDDPSGVQIDIGSHERTGLSLAQARESEKLQKVCAILCIGVEFLCADILDNRLELFPRWRQPNRFLPLDVSQMCGGRFGNHPIAKREREYFFQYLDMRIARGSTKSISGFLSTVRQPQITIAGFH